MLGSSLPSRRANSSSSIPFIPRQVMLESKGAVAAKEDGKERRKEKERKNRSSETFQLDRVEAGGAPHKGQGRDVLLRSIAAFLDSSGFSKTLSVLQSEAQLEIDCWKSSSFVNLEDLFCKFLDSSNGHAEATIDWPRDQDLQKVIISGEMEGKNMNCGPENTHKKKRKRTDRFDDGMETKANETLMEKGLGEGVNNGENLAVDGLQDKFKKKKTVGLASEGLFADNANISSDNLKVLTALNENSDPKKLKTAEDLHAETKEKKKKKKKVHDPSTDGAENKHSEVSHVTVESTDAANQSPEPLEKHKEKKKKHKVMPEIHDEIAEPSDSGKLKESVKAKMEEVISLTNNSFEPNMKHKSEKKKEKKLKQVQLEASEGTSNKNPKDMKLVSTESQTGLASTNPLDDNDSQHKVKKKKPKSCSDVVSTVSPDQAGEEKSTNQIKEFDFNQDIEASDFGHRSVPASEDLNIKFAKKVSKKRKVVDLGEKAENEIARKEPKVKSEGAEDNEGAESIVKSDKSILDSDTPVKTKKRKTEECKESSKNAGEQLDLSIKCKKNGSASNSKNEVVGHQLENGSIGNNSKKEQHSAEPKSVNPFQRVKVDEVKFVDDRLKDNSYWAKDGADSGYGAKAQEVLGQVRGRDFRHEKTKKKRGTYRGGQIDLQSHSIKFNYSDDD